jgi:hypothetical protein
MSERGISRRTALLGERLASSGQNPGAAAVAAIKPAIFVGYADARQADARSFDGPAVSPATTYWPR